MIIKRIVAFPSTGKTELFANCVKHCAPKSILTFEDWDEKRILAFKLDSQSAVVDFDFQDRLKACFLVNYESFFTTAYAKYPFFEGVTTVYAVSAFSRYLSDAITCFRSVSNQEEFCREEIKKEKPHWVAKMYANDKPRALSWFQNWAALGVTGKSHYLLDSKSLISSLGGVLWY